MNTCKGIAQVVEILFRNRTICPKNRRNSEEKTFISGFFYSIIYFFVFLTTDLEMEKRQNSTLGALRN